MLSGKLESQRQIYEILSLKLNTEWRGLKPEPQNLYFSRHNFEPQPRQNAAPTSLSTTVTRYCSLVTDRNGRTSRFSGFK
jgi:hypothetical protein